MLTNEDLRKLVGPAQRDNKVSRQLNEQNKKYLERKSTRKLLKKQNAAGAAGA